MADRIKGLTVSLTHDIRDDDCQSIIDAIKMIKGVEEVETHIADAVDWIARKQVKGQLREIISEWFDAL